MLDIAPLRLVSGAAQAAGVLVRAGILRPLPPDQIASAVLALARWGVTPAAGYAAAAARCPDAAAIIDERGSATFSDIHERTDVLARAFRARGVVAGRSVAVLCRNHRGMIEASVAANKLGADVLYLNTDFAGPQIADVLARHSPVLIVADEEFTDRLEGVSPAVPRIVAWGDGDRTLDSLVRTGHDDGMPVLGRTSRAIILTSGTTGTPKGVARHYPASIDPIVAFLSRIPYRHQERILVAAPIFHAWGFAHASISLLLCGTLVLQRRFDPERLLATVEEHQVTALAAVPAMLQRLLDVPENVRRRYDLSSLRIVSVSGSPLSASLATRFMDAFGDILYNLYGSTEVAWAAIATPEDLRAAPGTVGRPAAATRVHLLDDACEPVAAGETGRIFAGNALSLATYVDGDHRESVDGLVATGDIGHFDAEGRLFVDGREDDMIVSGGESVFPQEVEHAIAAHPDVAEAAVLGVTDERFGQRLKAYVVTRDGAALTAEDVRAYVRANLARYKVPRDVEFVGELPRTPQGKVDRRALTSSSTSGNVTIS